MRITAVTGTELFVGAPTDPLPVVQVETARRDPDCRFVLAELPQAVLGRPPAGPRLRRGRCSRRPGWS
jgi:hypothetical protein